MGTMEIGVRKSRKRRRIQQAVLSTIGAVGILGVALVAPNVLQILPKVLGSTRYKLAFQARTALQRLSIKGHIRFVERNGVRCATLTEKGQQALFIEQERAMRESGKRRKWDGLYRIVAFDIPEKRKGVREQLRGVVHSFGFLQLQKSMWVYPYDCEDLIALVKADLRIGKDVLYMIVESVENDRWIREHFKLL
ncbi:MAG: hypothetical protein Q8R25_03515 [bacterium]|nr:hypothetical protein [bacterium]